MGRALLPDALRVRDEDDTQVTFLELFFDLVFVFAITQLSGRLFENLSFVGAAETLLLFMVVWWAWIYTTWMTNWFNADGVAVRVVLITGMLASTLMAIAIPDAFGERALLFAGGYVGLQFVRNLFIVLAVGEDEPLHASFRRILVWNTSVGLVWIAGALAPESARAEVWLVALVLDYAGPLAGYWAPWLGRTDADEWEIDPRHFAERFQQFVIIVLGESIVLTGVTAAELELTPERMGAIVTAFTITAFLWWLYFDEVAERSSSELVAADESQGRLARDAYTYLHLPIVAGVVVAAVGNELVIAGPDEHLATAELVVLAAGPILYLLGHNLFRLRMTGTLWRLRMVALVVIAATCALGSGLPALALWAIIAATLIPVALVETRARVGGASLVP